MSDPARSREAIAVCIPIRNEASELPGLFAALDALRPPRDCSVHVALLLHRCSDDSETLARTYRRAARFPVHIETATSDATVGAARHRAMQVGQSLFSSGENLLLTTDADSRPPCEWLLKMQDALRHADVVAGRIVRTSRYGRSDTQDRIERYYDTLFHLRRALDPVAWEAPAAHHYASGANLGFRASAYTAVGGFQPLATGEDARIVDDASRLGLRVRRDGACLVETSDRRSGRVPVGLATALARSDSAGAEDVFVAHPADAAWQYRQHARVRAAFGPSRWSDVASALGLTCDHVVGVARDCPNAEAFAMRIVPVPPGGMRTVPLAVAERELATLADFRAVA